MSSKFSKNNEPLAVQRKCAECEEEQIQRNQKDQIKEEDEGYGVVMRKPDSIQMSNGGG